MPKSYSTSSSRYTISFNGPGNEQEYNVAAQRGDNACVTDAVMNVIYRDTLPDWQDQFMEALEKLTGVARGVDEKRTEKARKRAKEGAKVKDVKETFLDYDDRVWAAADDEMKKQITQLAVDTAKSITVDPAPGRREGQAGAEYLNKAKEILTRDDDAIEAAVTKCLEAVPGFELERDTDTGKPAAESLAKLIRARVQALSAL